MLAPRKTLWSTPGVGVEAACQLLRLGAEDKVIDVGCGDGAMVPHLRARAAYCGVDLSARMVSLARRRHPDARLERASCPSEVPARVAAARALGIE